MKNHKTSRLFLCFLLIFLLKSNFINACKPPIINGSTEVCANNNLTFTTQYSAGYFFKWEAIGATIFTSNTADTIGINWQNSGNYKVKVWVTDSVGCYDSAEISVQVKNAPYVPVVADTTVCFGTVFNYNYNLPNIISVLWDFGNGFTSTEKQINYTFDSAAYYPVKLTVVNNIGCTATGFFPITVAPKPNAKFKINLVDNVAFITAEDGSLKQYFFYLNYSRTPISQNKSFISTFDDVDSFHLRLVVTDSFGCTSFYDSTVILKPVDIQDFEAFPIQINVFPNPAKNIFTIEYELENNQKIQVYLTDLFGRIIIISEEMTLNIGKQKLIINAEKFQLKSGIYFLHIASENINYQPVKLLLIN